MAQSVVGSDLVGSEAARLPIGARGRLNALQVGGLHLASVGLLLLVAWTAEPDPVWLALVSLWAVPGVLAATAVGSLVVAVRRRERPELLEGFQRGLWVPLPLELFVLVCLVAWGIPST